MARAGVAVGAAGAIALAIHAAAYTKEKQRQADCDAWRRARAEIAHGAPAQEFWPSSSEWVQRAVSAKLRNRDDMRALWEARDLIAQHPLAISELVSWVSDPTFVGLRTSEAVSIDGRDMPYFSCGTHVQDDLFRRAGRASWLLREATGHASGVVGVETDPIQLADLARDWLRWLDDLDSGLACFPALR